MRSRLATLSCALLLAGCMVGPNYQRPDLQLPSAFPAVSPPGEAAAQVAPQWWTLYHDATLDELVRAGLERNADLRLAAARVEEAQAALREARAVLLFPEIDATAGGVRGRSFLPGLGYGTGNSFNLGVSTSFEVDVWGRLRRAERSVRDELLASRYGRDTVELTLEATIARTYFSILSLDSQYTASQEIVTAASDSANLAQKRLDNGVGSALDLYQAASLRDSSSAQARAVARQRTALAHQLGILTGRLDVDVPTRQLATLADPPLPPPGLPSQLLERRPDVRQAELQLASATEQIGVARGSQFPKLSLTGSFGSQSGELHNLLRAGSRVWSVGADFTGPILDGGRYAARTQQAEARAKQAEATYQRAVESAFRDVADALTNLESGVEEDRDLASQVTQAREALRLANLRYQQGYSAFLEVLDAQRTLNLAQLQFIRSREGYLTYTVDLMAALGGGWSDKDHGGEK